MGAKKPKVKRGDFHVVLLLSSAMLPRFLSEVGGAAATTTLIHTCNMLQNVDIGVLVFHDMKLGCGVGVYVGVSRLGGNVHLLDRADTMALLDPLKPIRYTIEFTSYFALFQYN